MTEKMPRATHQGILRIAGSEMPCAVLDNGTRIISRNAIFRAFGRTKRGRGKDIRVLNMPSFIDAKNLQPFISQDLHGGLKPFQYEDLRGKVVAGYDASILPLICDVYLSARTAGELTESQQRLAVASEMLVRGFAKIGIIALVDEATGYQDVRIRDALQQILDKYLRQEYAKWAKRFPDEFYKEMFRLKGWHWQSISKDRPKLVGRYTADVVYARLAPGVLDELRRKNPVTETGQRRRRHHQWLTDDIGIPHLSHHLSGVIALMRAASNWDGFKRLLVRAYPKLTRPRPDEQLLDFGQSNSLAGLEGKEDKDK